MSLTSSKADKMSNKALYSCLWCLILLSMGFLSFGLIGNLTKAGLNVDRSKLLFTNIYEQDTEHSKFPGINGPIHTRRLSDDTIILYREAAEKSKALDAKANENFKENSKQLVAKANENDQVIVSKQTTPQNDSEYIIQDTKVNPFNFEFLKTGENICDKDNPPYIILLCLTTYFDVDNRKTIRETWGSIAKNGTWPRQHNLPVVKLVFLFGGPADSRVKKAILDEESELYNDVVMADFKDSYFNLTYKVMMGLKWVTMHCQNAKYVVKVDQDMFLHVPNLIYFLKSINDTDTDPGIVVGFVNYKARVLRTGKWGLSRKIFPPTSYPPYSNGNSYVISGKAAAKMLDAAERIPYIFIEDAFITGIVRAAVGLEIIDHKGFAKWSDRPPRLCSFHNLDRIAATNTNDDLKRTIWIAQSHPNLRNCYSILQRNK